MADSSKGNFRVIVVVFSLLFLLYWSGTLQSCTISVLSTVISSLRKLAPKYHIQYTQDSPQNVDDSDDSEEGAVEHFEELLNEHGDKLGDGLMTVVDAMESLISTNELDTMSDSELEETFEQLHSMYPLIDKVFESLAEQNQQVSLDPKFDLHEVQRRYQAMKNVIDKRKNGVTKNANIPTNIDSEETLVEDEL